MMKKEVFIEGMKCEGCANTVQDRFSAIEGVESVEIDLANKSVLIESQSEVPEDTLVVALADTKYSLVDQN